jgi:hypothetical protein
MWFETGQLDMAWINKFMVTGLMVLYKMNRFHAVLELGGCQGGSWGGPSRVEYTRSDPAFTDITGSQCPTDCKPDHGSMI